MLHDSCTYCTLSLSWKSHLSSTSWWAQRRSCVVEKATPSQFINTKKLVFFQVCASRSVCSQFQQLCSQTASVQASLGVFCFHCAHHRRDGSLFQATFLGPDHFRWTYSLASQHMNHARKWLLIPSHQTRGKILSASPDVNKRHQDCCAVYLKVARPTAVKPRIFTSGIPRVFGSGTV